MEVKDIAAVQQVAAESWHDTYEGIIPREIRERFLEAAYSPDMLKRRMEQSLVLVAQHAGLVVGFANFYRLKEPGAAELSAVYLLPSHQGLGLGSSLLKNGLDQLAEVERLYVTVERDNVTARKFYEARGFRMVEEFEEDFGGHTLNSVRMVRSLL